MKTTEKQQKTTEGVLIYVFKLMIKKKAQGCFATFLYFVGNFPSFSKLLDALGKRLKVQVNVKQC